MTSPDVGFYFKWEIDDEGLPYGCDVFNTVTLDCGHTDECFHEATRIGNNDCPKQDLPEKGKKGMPLWKRVEKYADNNQMWMKDFSRSFKKMQENGYGSGDLIQGPSDFWTFECKQEKGMRGFKILASSRWGKTS